jgi:peptidoglycan/LPS O-acetylase OafA/YrhL
MAYPLFLGFMTLCSIATYATPLYESSITAVLIAITSDTTNLSLKFLRWSPLVFLGRISYSVYLWNGIFMLQIHSYLSQLEALVLVPAFSLISYYFIEQSGVQLGARLMKRKAASQRSTDSSTTTAPSVSGA